MAEMNCFDPMTSTFLLAGPVKIHPRVLLAMSSPSMNHRGEDFHQIVHEIKGMLPLVFGRPGHQAVVTGSGTAGLESMIASILGPDDKVLVLSNGHFGARLEKIGARFAKPTVVKAEWGHPFDIEAIKKALAETKPKAVLGVYNETSVGFTNDMAAIGPVIKDSGALFLMDAISGLPGIPAPADSWGVDGIVVGSQKAIAAPAGLAMVHLSDRAFAALNPHTFAGDLVEHFKSIEKDDTPWTPAVPLFLALKEALLMLKEEGVDTRIERTKNTANATRAAVKAMGLSLFPEEKYASNTVTAIRYPDGVEDGAFRKALREHHNVVVSGGQGQVKGKIFRFGHMGIASYSDLLVGVAAVERELFRMGKLKSIGPGVSTFLSKVP
jgi:aspartate aminotransferase-like enzyme